MKKKRFYSNKKRNSKWTEQEQGRPIDFSEKYLYDGNYSDKFDPIRGKEKQPVFSKGRLMALLKRTGVVICCFLLIGVGYTAMDFYMERKSMPSVLSDQEESGGISSVTLSFQSKEIETFSLDGASMVSAVIDAITSADYSSAAFDLKREDGTIAYSSSLAAVDTFGAVSSACPNLKASVQMLLANDLLPIGKIACYRDNVVPGKNLSIALTKDGQLYYDSDGNTYLNPDSEDTYAYLKDIIEETAEMGISVFVLDCYELPEEISGDYQDGFDTLQEKLQSDLGSDIKILKAVSMEFDPDDLDAQTSMESLFLSQDGSDTVFYLTTQSEESAKKQLLDANINNFIIAQ